MYIFWEIYIIRLIPDIFWPHMAAQEMLFCMYQTVCVLPPLSLPITTSPLRTNVHILARPFYRRRRRKRCPWLITNLHSPPPLTLLHVSQQNEGCFLPTLFPFHSVYFLWLFLFLWEKNVLANRCTCAPNSWSWMQKSFFLSLDLWHWIFGGWGWVRVVEEGEKTTFLLGQLLLLLRGKEGACTARYAFFLPLGYRNPYSPQRRKWKNSFFKKGELYGRDRRVCCRQAYYSTTGARVERLRSISGGENKKEVRLLWLTDRETEFSRKRKP